MKTLLTSLGLATLVGLAVSYRQPETASAPPAAGSESAAAPFQIDAGHSAVVFRCIHLGISQAYGRFNEFGGDVVFDEADLSQSSIQITIQADSVDTNHEQRDTHLRSPDFLSAKENPEISFVSTKIGGTAEKLEVEGDLTFHGQTQSVQATGAVIGAGDTPFGDHRVGFEVRFTIDMGDYGVEYVEQNPGGVGPEVDLTVSLECVRK
jgi:polyisoprenoid-binding protein YceI